MEEKDVDVGLRGEKSERIKGNWGRSKFFSWDAEPQNNTLWTGTPEGSSPVLCSQSAQAGSGCFIPCPVEISTCSRMEIPIPLLASTPLFGHPQGEKAFLHAQLVILAFQPCSARLRRQGTPRCSLGHVCACFLSCPLHNPFYDSFLALLSCSSSVTACVSDYKTFKFDLNLIIKLWFSKLTLLKPRGETCSLEP